MEWSANLAYAVGLIATDGCLARDGRHIDLTSKDKEQLENFLVCLGKRTAIGKKKSGSGREHFRVQFSDVSLYKFLVTLGLTPNKTKTLQSLKIPPNYFFDFLRGHFDGDGTFYSYWDSRWKSSYMFYTVFISASKKHIDWLRGSIYNKLGIKGHITKSINNSIYQLKYAKGESLKLLPRMYYNEQIMHLSRKRLKINEALNADVEKLADSLP